jgi:regulator of replication initiation timing
LGGRGRQISKFEDSLVYKVSSRIARATERNPVSKKQTNKQTNKQTKKKEKEKEKKKMRNTLQKLFFTEFHKGLTHFTPTEPKGGNVFSIANILLSNCFACCFQHVWQILII